MANYRMEMYYNSNPQFVSMINTFVQDIIDKDENFDNAYEYFEYDGKFFDVHIFKDQSNIKAYVYWTIFKLIDQQDLFITQEHDVMPLGYFQGREEGADYVQAQA